MYGKILLLLLILLAIAAFFVFDLGAYTRHVDVVFDRLHALIRREEPVHA